METRFRPLVIVALATFFACASASCADPDERIAKEFKLLEGVWAEDPPKGDGRRNAVQFKVGKMGWQSTRYKVGEPLIGHSKVYEVRLGVTATPKEITLTWSEKDDQETRLGIYEVNGETLKIALDREKGRPTKLDDMDAQVLMLKKVRAME